METDRFKVDFEAATIEEDGFLDLSSFFSIEDEDCLNANNGDGDDEEEGEGKDKDGDGDVNKSNNKNEIDIKTFISLALSLVNTKPKGFQQLVCQRTKKGTQKKRINHSIFVIL